MKHRLPRPRPHIEHCPVSLLDIPPARKLRGGYLAAADQFGIAGSSFLQSSKMFLRDDEHMGRRLRVDVLKGEDILVFVNFLRGNLAAQDAAEKAVARSVGHRSVTLAKR